MTDGYRVIRELEEAIAMLIFFFFFNFAKHPDLSTFFCRLQDFGQGSQNLLSTALRVRPQFRVSLCRVYELVTPVLKYPVVHGQKVWLRFSPPTLIKRYHQLLPQQISCVGLLIYFNGIFIQEKNPKFSKP